MSVNLRRRDGTSTPDDLRYRRHLQTPRRPFPGPEGPARLVRPTGDRAVLVDHAIVAAPGVAAERELFDVIEGLHAGRRGLRAVEAIGPVEYPTVLGHREEQMPLVTRQGGDTG